jgi:hypothetical protein
MRKILYGLTMLVAASGSLAAESAAQPIPDEPPMLGIRWQHGVVPGTPGSKQPTAEKSNIPPGATGSSSKGSSDLLTYQGGGVLRTTNITAIFWGTNWARTGGARAYANPAFVVDQIDGLDRFYTGYKGSDYEKASVLEYYQVAGGTQQPIQAAGTNYGGHVIDGSTAAAPTSTKAPLQEVCSVILKSQQAGASGLDTSGLTAPASGIVPTGDGTDYFALYYDQPPPNGYCAYHSYGTCKWSTGVAVAGSSAKVTSMPVTFGVFFHYSPDISCDSGDGPYDASIANPASNTSSYINVSKYTGHSQILAALATNSAHELSEARTDPGWAVNADGSLNTSKAQSAWRDASGSENADKCSWNTGPGTNFYTAGYSSPYPEYSGYTYSYAGKTNTVVARCPVAFNAVNPAIGYNFNNSLGCPLGSTTCSSSNFGELWVIQALWSNRAIGTGNGFQAVGTASTIGAGSSACALASELPPPNPGGTLTYPGTTRPDAYFPRGCLGGSGP